MSATAFSASLSYNKQSDHTEVKPTITNNVVINPSTTESSEVSITQSDGTNKIRLPPKQIKTIARSFKPEPVSTASAEPISVESTTNEPITPLETAATNQRLTIEPTVPETIVERIDDPIPLFEHKLLRIVIGIFQQDMKLIKNIIEPSKDIVLTKTDLIDLIKTLTGESEVEITSSPQPSSCLARIKFIDKIDRIVVGDGDFSIIYNTTYNKLKQYHIALDKCFTY